MIESKREQFSLIPTPSIMKKISHFSYRRLTRRDKLCSSISPPSKVFPNPKIHHSRPKSTLNLLNNIQFSLNREKKTQNKPSEIQQISKLIEKNTLNQNSESLNIELKQLHESILSKISNLPHMKTLLDYNFDITQQITADNLLNNLLLQLKKGCSGCGFYCKTNKSKFIDLTEFNNKAYCSVCKNSFLVRIIMEGFVCEQCSKGNVLQKTPGNYLQISLCNNQIPSIKTPSQEFLNFYTDRFANMTPNRAKPKKPENPDQSSLSDITILLPNKENYYVGQSQPAPEFIKKISDIKEKGKLVSRDLITLMQEQKNFNLQSINTVQDVLGEYAKRLRTLLKEISQFIPEHCQALETIFKAQVLGIDSLITTFNSKIQNLNTENSQLRQKLADQETLKTQLKKSHLETSQTNKKNEEEIKNLKALIDRYKFTVELYKKELDHKELLNTENKF
jgi:hypothetical protein